MCLECFLQKELAQWYLVVGCITVPWEKCCQGLLQWGFEGLSFFTPVKPFLLSEQLLSCSVASRMMWWYFYVTHAIFCHEIPVKQIVVCYLSQLVLEAQIWRMFFYLMIVLLEEYIAHNMQLWLFRVCFWIHCWTSKIYVYSIPWVLWPRAQVVQLCLGGSTALLVARKAHFFSPFQVPINSWPLHMASWESVHFGNSLMIKSWFLGQWLLP